MSGPFAEGSIVVEFETGEPDRFYRIDPDGLSGDVWLFRPGEIRRAQSRAAIVERLALPEADEYRVDLVEVPPGETLYLGEVAPRGGRDGGGELLKLTGRDSIPGGWVRERTTVDELVDREGSG